MIDYKYLLFFIIVFSQTINSSSLSRMRRLINPIKRDIDSFLNGQIFQPKAPSGSIHGTSYYAPGADPNYGSFVRPPNTANSGGVLPISYNPSSNQYSYILNQNSQQQQRYEFNNNNNAGQRPYTNYIYNQPSNRYPPGSPGWYATGGNYWYSNGISIIAHPFLLMLNLLILMICQ